MEVTLLLDRKDGQRVLQRANNRAGGGGPAGRWSQPHGFRTPIAYERGRRATRRAIHAGQTSDPLDSAASPEELNDEDALELGDGGNNAPKQCTYEGCAETTTQVAKQRKPWMCKKHRNKMYKDKYKKKKSDQALSEERPVSVNKQRLGNIGDRPARPSLIEQVLNQKRLSLLRSPEVITFLQQQQRLLVTQSRSQS
ncbi:hypothetical protein CRUP_021829 [Coryphaenoides rupestris]|nr:hypothetical protein CRUP_021829 [Coryphaenoides rupestris]